ncbi:MAG: exonuclease SbcCD subunit D [Chloroflexi bacterium]|nr:exonuclease SbcCD subunit D [Chloroflexota bacterium]
MRILHFADVHIGVENYGRTDPDTGLSTRLSDFLAAYDEVVDYALSQSVDLVLFCGDAYKSRDPSQTHQREFAKRVARLAASGVPVFLLVGNHDTPHVLGRATSLEIFQTLDVSNVHIGDTLRTYRIPTRRDGPVQIVAVPWVRRGAFLSQDDRRGLSPDQVNEAIQERLARAIRQQADDLDASVPAIFAGHVTVSDATTGSERTMMLGRDYVLLRSSVALPQFDYVALGHIHKYQILGSNPLVVYSGSLQRVDFGEESDEKGFCVVELDPREKAGSRLKQHQFQTVRSRTFRTVSVDIRTGDPDPTATVLKAIAATDIRDAVVRLQISVPAELEGRLRDADIRAALDGAHFVAAVSREVKGQPRNRLGAAYSEGIDPREALKHYFEEVGTPRDRTEVLMRRAEQLMEEQDSQ